MDIEGLHVKYQELDKGAVVKEGDSVNFSNVKNEIEKIYLWEGDYYNATEYRDQLPEDNRKSIENEFATVLSQLSEIARLRSTDISALAQRRTDIATSIKNLYRTIYDIFTRDFRGWQIENEGSAFTRNLQDVVKKAEEELAKSVKEGGEKAEQKTDEVVQKIVGAESTKEWAREYLPFIKPDASIKASVMQEKRNYKQSRDKYPGKMSFLKPECSIALKVLKCFWFTKIRGGAFYAGDSYLNLSNRWRFWRSLAYFLLFLITIYYLVHSIMVGAPNKAELLNFFLQKVTALPLVTVLAIGLIFASKNYRVNLNLLEEYKHRYIVAKTIQNLLLLPENARLRMDLLTKGTSILFEHRTSGYMDNDSESLVLEKLLSTQNISLNLNKKS